ncbi:uncharacterized protein MONOS_7823 [Monocercomonoides exilis]|uniref:uncharacterized protein n=1 Tax=Monocercomonoides exilis TaxID=2049356 RepID=UPI00355A84A8|nr:hypothetical protein MONOS_7823 [Monocercomonoides exilis]|eukprot:MONOS_7823.1-p1 / transcript=MONOS_7823.1 / gene=MONOS_7823 / organism=Monocercomonoides_exilis_PA203 / gene_product=unspecified product / transcript_product=unspecified product / location=Mono_scaffold00278:3871-5265(+) / protein_length=465 / sequence_SO=supercontig / SO=protein_coding / is_pseudo=false
MGGAAGFIVHSGEVNVIECIFINCREEIIQNSDEKDAEGKEKLYKGGGGGICFLGLKRDAKIRILNCEFADCTSSLCGGALYFGRGNGVAWNVTIKSSAFIGYASLMDYGEDVFWNAGSEQGFKIENCASRTREGRDREVDIWGPFMRSRAGLTDETAYVSASGSDGASCGGSDATACLTISYVLTTLASSTTVSRVVLVGARQEQQRYKINLTQETKIGCASDKTAQPMNVSADPFGGYAVINCSLTVENVEYEIIDLEGDLFYIGEMNGKLYLTNITTQFVGGFDPMVYALVRFEGNTLEMVSCVVNLFSLSNVPIVTNATLPSSLPSRSILMKNVAFSKVSCSKAQRSLLTVPKCTSLTLNNCSFSNVSSTNCATGGALRVEINRSDPVRIIDTNFSLCSAIHSTDTTKGGGLYLLLTVAGDVEFTNPTFASNNAAVGKDVFVTCDLADENKTYIYIILSE